MLLSSKIVNQSKPILFLLLIAPSIFWTIMFVQNNLGVNPIEKLLNELGEFALLLLIATLVISSLAQSKYLRSLQNIRRMIGLFAFYYVTMHFITYIFLDHFFNTIKNTKSANTKKRFTNFSTPKSCISFLDLNPRAFSTSTSTHNPWQSNPF